MPKKGSRKKLAAGATAEDFIPGTPTSEQPAAQPEPSVSRSNSSVAYVLTASGKLARSYNYQDHGPQFADLAAQYAKKIGGRVK